MLCSSCGTENDAGRRFCDTCGAPLTVVCRVCGSSNRPSARFGLGRLIGLHESLRVHGDAISAERVILRAGFAALEGRLAEAHAGYRDAIESWRDLGLDWEEALAGLDMATVLDRDQPDVATAIIRSREIFERLRARPFLERLLRPGGAASGAMAAVSPVAIAATATPTAALD